MTKAKLNVYLDATSPAGTQTYETNRSEFVFGRSGKAHIKVDDAGISREHFKIKIENDTLYVMDLNSLNGVFIDGYKINPMEFIAFQEKTILSFGKYPITIKIRFVSEQPDEAKTVIYSSPPEKKLAKLEENTTEKSKDLEAQIADEFEVIDFNDKKETPIKPIEKKEDEVAAASIIKANKNTDSPPLVKQDVSGALNMPAKAQIKPKEYVEDVPQAHLLNLEPLAPKAQEDVSEKTEIEEVISAELCTDNNKSNKDVKFDDKKIDSLSDEQIMASRPEQKTEFDKLINISAFPKSEEDFRISFKNVGLDVPKYKNPGQHAKEIIREAEYQKHAIIKSAEVFKSRTINETRIQAKKASEEAHNEFKKMVDNLLDNTRSELKKLRTDTELLIDEKRLQANEEIQRQWEEHEEQIRIDKEKQREVFESDNKIKLDLSIEKARSDMFAERHKIVTDAENEVIQKKRTFQVEFENERSEHLMKIKAYTEELNKIQSGIEENKRIIKESKISRDDAELELSKALSLLKVEKENLAILNNSFKETEDSHKKIEHELATFNETKQKAIAAIEKTQSELDRLNLSYANLTEKKHMAEQDLQILNENLKNSKAKAKAEVETEYANLKAQEAKKFEDYRVNELKELQKIRDAHSDSIKNFSVDLSQEIATKLELLASKSGYSKFDFEKHFELINSVIQIKGAVNTGSESKHAQQLESWKNRKRKENFVLISQGFAVGLVVVFALNFVYQKLNIDPVQQELARLAAENKSKDVENRFVPVKTGKYYDTYLETTLYTDRFSDIYLNDKNQQEWVNYASKYFLRQWKIEEEKVIEVISNSNALVQNVVTEMPRLKKSKLKSDLAKLKELEDEYVKNQAQILGSNVRYEAYKKIEKEFFQSKLQGRVPASQD
jgi:pSer/pThr/pTyr-binding forkhead associated (FHA) protein